MKKARKVIALFLCLITVIVNTEVTNAATSKNTTPKLNKSTLQLYEGKTATLKVLNNTKKATKIAKVAWKSKNSKVATVTSNGKVTARKAGNTTITAKVGSKKLNCKVVVKAVKLNKSKITLKVGETATLKLTGDKVKNWTSKNKSVATVNKSGKVTAKKEGTTTITGLSSRNKKYRCVVKVKKQTDVKPIPVDNITPTVTIKITPTATPTNKPKQLVITIPYGYTIEQYLIEHPEMSAYYEMFKENLAIVTAIPTATVTPTAEPTKDITVTPTDIPRMILPIPYGYTVEQYMQEHPELQGYYDIYKDLLIVVTATPTANPKSTVTPKPTSTPKPTATNTPTPTIHIHNYVLVDSKKEDCTTAGYSVYRCNCGDSYTTDRKALGHDYVLKNTVQPNCTTDGYELMECTRCKDSYKTPIKALGHNFEFVKTVEPNCISEGYDLKKCTRCSEERKENILPHNDAHQYTLTQHVEPNCTDSGKDVYTCKLCNKKLESYIAPKGHTMKESVIAETDTESGYTLHTCATCGYNYKDNYTDACLGLRKFSYSISGDKVVLTKLLDTNTSVLHISDKYQIRGQDYNTVVDCSFDGCSSLFEVRLAGDINKVSFKGCKGLMFVIFGKATTQNLYTLESAFEGCNKLLDVTGDLEISNVTSTSKMFSGCTDLRKVSIFENGTKYEKLENTSEMFAGCNSLKSIKMPAEMFYVQDASGMFQNCFTIKNIDLPNFGSEYTKNCKLMFNNCAAINKNDSNTYIDMSKTFASFIKSNAPSGFYGINSMFEGCPYYTVDNFISYNLQ